MYKHITILVFILISSKLSAEDVNYTSWKFNSINDISAVDFSKEGDPEVVDINDDKALYFDGTEDRILVNENPLIGLDEFTFEVIFKVDKGGVSEQKFLHMQASPDIRILFEIEFVNDDMWYMENYIQSGSGEGENAHLMDESKLHPAGRWYHASITYKDNMFKQYINYTLENEAEFSWVTPSDGSVSVGARMNQLNYLTGAVREIRFANAALAPEDFLLKCEMLEESETYVLDDLEVINDYDVVVSGNPEVVDTELGKGISFDGNGDGIYIYNNPIGESQQFTIETIVKINDVYPNNIEPRYFHIEDESNSNRRITMEIRLNDNHEWYFDGFLRADDNSIGLMEDYLVHPIEGWSHMAIVYDNGYFATYVDYDKELESNWDKRLLPFSDNTKMSVGMRMNKVHYFNGIIQRIRITHAVLEPEEFMPLNNGSTAVSKIKAESLGVMVYPNPASGNARIELSASKGGHTCMELYSTSGQKICDLYKGNIPSGVTSTAFNTGSVEKGMYLLKVAFDNQVETEKILVL